MIDLSSCPRLDSKWTTLTELFSRALTLYFPLSVRAALIVFLCFTLAWLYWTVPRSKYRRYRSFYWNRRRTRMVVAMTVICLLVTSPPSVNLASKILTTQVAPDSGMKVDAIVVLGREKRVMGDRVAVSAKLWQEKRAPKIFVSGIGAAPIMLGQLKAIGIPVEGLDGEGCSLTTEENARFSAEKLKPQGVKRILLITDAPHLLRSLLTFESFGFDVIPHATNLPRDLGYREKAAIVFREYGGLIIYSLKGRFFLRQQS